MLAVDTEIQLPVQGARAGEPDAWDALFKRYQLPLYAYAFELLRDEQASLDVVQESFITAVRHIRSLQNDDKFGSWIFSIAHQRCIQHWRRNGREHPVEVEELEAFPSDDLDPSEWCFRREQEEQVMDLLGHLPPPQRAVLLLHFLEDFSLEEIARITESPMGTVKSRLHYAKSALRRLLEDQRP